jgi:hypothetical protein
VKKINVLFFPSPLIDHRSPLLDPTTINCFWHHYLIDAGLRWGTGTVPVPALSFPPLPSLPTRARSGIPPSVLLDCEGTSGLGSPPSAPCAPSLFAALSVRHRKRRCSPRQFFHEAFSFRPPLLPSPSPSSSATIPASLLPVDCSPSHRPPACPQPRAPVSSHGSLPLVLSPEPQHELGTPLTEQIRPASTSTPPPPSPFSSEGVSHPFHTDPPHSAAWH